jgi:hypothetical protein
MNLHKLCLEPSTKKVGNKTYKTYRIRSVHKDSTGSQFRKTILTLGSLSKEDLERIVVLIQKYISEHRE